MNTITVEWLATRITARTTQGIAEQTRVLIAEGALAPGHKLPPLRTLAFAMNISPATLSNAWKELRKYRVITGKGRNGSWISGGRATLGPVRFLDVYPGRMMPVAHYNSGTLDLAWATPDPKLLPPLDKALQHAIKAHNLNSYEREKILPELQEIVEERWPYTPEAFLVTNGGYSAIHTVLHTLYQGRLKIAVEDPTPMRILDILEDMEAEIVPVVSDMHGPVPYALAEALQEKPDVFLYQPRVHAITGAHPDPERMQQLAALLEKSRTLILEDDGLGDISAQKPLSLGRYFPERTIHILSFSKSLGPDLRVAVLSAPMALITRLQSFRAFSSGWTSRILQSAVAWCLRDDETAQRLAQARQIYMQRREALRGALAARDIHTERGTGENLCLWIPVQDEQFAMITLASRHIAVLPGSKCSLRPVQAMRISTSKLENDYDRVAEAVALSLKPGTLF